MPTHQSLSGTSDEQFLQRMLQTHPHRYGADFWKFFADHVAPHVAPRSVMIDLGCGPGLFVRDLSERYPGATLYGYDVTPAMIAHAQQLPWSGAKPTFAVLDVTKDALPNAAASVHLVAMSSVLHVLDEPLPVLAEIRRVLAPGGIFLLHDWIRQPLAWYLAWRRDVMGEDVETSLKRGFRLFPVHNKYTPADWQWLLAESGLAIRHQDQLRPTHTIFVAAPGAR